jgi:hypothetical protein
MENRGAEADRKTIIEGQKGQTEKEEERLKVI